MYDNATKSSKMSLKNNKKVVIALGGNALMQKYDSGSAEEQFKQTRKSLDPLFHFIEQDVMASSFEERSLKFRMQLEIARQIISHLRTAHGKYSKLR